MNMITFQALAMRTSPRDGHDKLDNAVLGLIGVPLEKVAEMNIEKLKKRYPDGFDAAISEGRYAK